MLNRDIGFVHVGQDAVVKVESFPFTRYGSVKAHVVRIAKDAIPSPDASAMEGDPARASNASGFAGGERTQNLVFAVELAPDAADPLDRRGRAPADLGHGGDGRNQDRRATPDGLYLLAPRRGRLARHAGEVKA